MKQVQDFYKATITQDWSIGTGNFYVSVKPTITEGWLYVSPNNASLREQIYYNGTGTDANGDYITITERGLGETTDQTHTIGEPIRMNIGEGYIEYLTDAIDDIVAGAAPDADTSTKGLVEIATDTEVIAGTDVGGTGAKLVATPSQINTRIDTKIAAIPSTVLTKFVGVGNTSNTSFENYKFLFGSSTTTAPYFGWTLTSTPTPSVTYCGLGSAMGIRRGFFDFATGAAMDISNTKIKIAEWDARITNDTSTATSMMGFSGSGDSFDQAGTATRLGICFTTNASGDWFTHTDTGGGTTNFTENAITKPSAGRHTFRIEYNPATPSALFYVDGTLVATHTTNFPTSGTLYLQFGTGTSSTIITHVGAPNVAIEK